LRRCRFVLLFHFFTGRLDFLNIEIQAKDPNANNFSRFCQAVFPFDSLEGFFIYTSEKNSIHHSRNYYNSSFQTNHKRANSTAFFV